MCIRHFSHFNDKIFDNLREGWLTCAHGWRVHHGREGVAVGTIHALAEEYGVACSHLGRPGRREKGRNKPGCKSIGWVSPRVLFLPTKLHLLKIYNHPKKSHQLGPRVPTQEPRESPSNHTMSPEGHVERGRSCPTVSKLIGPTWTVTLNNCNHVKELVKSCSPKAERASGTLEYNKWLRN